ncbi:MAG TPA: PH domain-containing protein [Thermoanaerobaculia bacterium]|nr:PH domain-containing protein [Thermoanaerobaculia bacterium]
MSVRDGLLRVLRVPPTPEPPPGSPPRIFRAAPNFFKLRLLRWGMTQIAALAGLIWAINFIRWIEDTRTPDFVVWLIQAGEVIGWILFALEFAGGWMLVRLDYELRWYMLSDRAVRIREGITTIREKTIALANIQNIAVRQGPLQRLLGIADVEVKTAGGGGSGSDMEKKSSGSEPMHVAYFRGVHNAEEIRDLLREGVRRQKDAGLGDPDEIVTAPDDDTERAVAELLTAARGLRQAVISR